MNNGQTNTNLNAPEKKGAKVYRHGRWPGLFALFMLVTACGTDSGPETSATPGVQTVTGSYKGPVPATADTQRFKLNFWDNLNSVDRCGGCHNNGGQSPEFVDETNVNLAYSQAITVVDATNIANSRVVTKVAGGHNCWLTDDNACATIIQSYVSDWLGAIATSGGREIQLTAPAIKDAGDSKTFPATAQELGANSFETLLHTPILTEYCDSCHDDSSSTAQSPFFANSDVNTAYDAARAKIDLDTPSNSRFVLRLREEFHNCWSNDCQADADEMETAIMAYANAITPTQVDSALVISKALTLEDAIIASGGIRYEDNVIALYEFKTGSGSTAFDTSGVEPALNLTFSGVVDWVLGFGIEIIDGKAQATTANSKKLKDFISATGEYSIEAWVIPGNVTQEEARIVSYSGGETLRNFTLGQSLYNYEFYNRIDTSTDPMETNGLPLLPTDDAEERLQATLQHVVMTYNPNNGRRIYVDGELVQTEDVVADPTLQGGVSNWQDNAYAFVLGHEAAGTAGLWKGKLRLVAIHNRELNQEQITQNYNVGVGQKFFMLFSVAERIVEPGFENSFILFEVEVFDNTSYLFKEPKFINLDPDWVPPSTLRINGLRLGINGKEAVIGQLFAHTDVTIDPAVYTTDGQSLLSTGEATGTIIPLEKGPDSDEFFLTFEMLGSSTYTFTDSVGVVAVPGADAEMVSDIGMRTFDEINATMASVTGISQAVDVDLDVAPYAAVKGGAPISSLPGGQEKLNYTFSTYKQQLPAIEDVNAFLGSHQMGVAQLAMSYCSVLVDQDALLTPADASRFFADFVFTDTAATAFDSDTKKDQIMDPLLVSLMNVDAVTPTNNLLSQPVEAEVKSMVGSTATQDLDASLSGDSYDSLVSCMTRCAVDGEGAAKCPIYVSYDPTDPLSVDDRNCSSAEESSQNTVARTQEVVKAMCASALGSAVMLVQ